MKIIIRTDDLNNILDNLHETTLALSNSFKVPDLMVMLSQKLKEIDDVHADDLRKSLQYLIADITFILKVKSEIGNYVKELNTMSEEVYKSDVLTIANDATYGINALIEKITRTLLFIYYEIESTIIPLEYLLSRLETHEQIIRSNGISWCMLIDNLKEYISKWDLDSESRESIYEQLILSKRRIWMHTDQTRNK